MKAKTFLFLGIVVVLAVSITNTASAQKGVIKVEICNSCSIGQPGCANPCVPGEWLVGSTCSLNLLSKNNWVTIDRGGTLVGWKLDEDGNPVRTGNVYTTHTTINGIDDKLIATIKLFQDGKLHSIIRYHYNTTINANGEVTASVFKDEVDCK
jgi:hypothetical protein